MYCKQQVLISDMKIYLMYLLTIGDMNDDKENERMAIPIDFYKRYTTVLGEERGCETFQDLVNYDNVRGTTTKLFILIYTHLFCTSMTCFLIRSVSHLYLSTSAFSSSITLDSLFKTLVK